MNPALCWQRIAGRWSESAGVPFSDRGFRHGAALFETVAIRAGQPLFWEEHLGLLRTAGRHFGYPEQGEPLEPPADLPAGDALLRLHWTTGDGAPGAPVVQPRLFAVHEPLPSPGLADEPRPARLAGPYIQSGLPANGWKTHLYWPRLRLLEQARSAGLDEMLLADEGGQPFSATTANVFFFSRGSWWTPSCAVGARPGVVRSWAMAALGASEEGAWQPEVTEEAFLTNSRLGILPVRAIGSCELPSLTKGAALRERYRKEILGR